VVDAQLAHLTAVRDRTPEPGARLWAVLEAFAAISHRHPDTELAAVRRLVTVTTAGLRPPDAPETP
jgi:hypothetical protein